MFAERRDLGCIPDSKMATVLWQ